MKLGEPERSPLISEWPIRADLLADGFETADPGPGPPAPRSVWWRPERAHRREGRSRSDIVAAALRLADAEGLDAVSMRRLAAELGTSAMSLYWYVQNKDELVELMFDALLGECLVRDELTTDWRENLRLLAHQRLEIIRAHPWVGQRRGDRPAFGPNWLHLIEQSLAAVTMLEPAVRRTALNVTDAYVIGFTRREIDRQRASAAMDTTDEELRRTLMPHLEQMFATGEYPILAEQFSAHPEMADPFDDTDFELGLDCILDGLARLVEASETGR